MVSNILKLKKIGIDSRNEHLVFMRSDCYVYRSEGFEAINRIRVAFEEKSLMASLINMDEPGQLNGHEIGLSNNAIDFLGANESEHLSLHHLPALDSINEVRAKIYGTAARHVEYNSSIEKETCG